MALAVIGRKYARPFSAGITPNNTSTPNLGYIGQYIVASVSNTAFASLNNVAASNFFPQAENRYIVGMLYFSTGQVLQQVTIAGIEAQRIARNALSSGSIEMFIVKIPNGEFLPTTASNGRGLPISARYAGNLFGGNGRVVLYGVTGLSSPVPRTAISTNAAVNTTLSLDLNTVPGGIIIAGANNDVNAANSCTWTGDQSPTKNFDTSGSGSGYQDTSANIINTNDDPVNTITATFAVASTTSIILVGASFR